MNNWEYELSELMPVMTKLVDKYTSKESSSVTYETARVLMEAVEYCIHQNKREKMNQNNFGSTKCSDHHLEDEANIEIVSREQITVQEAYERGYQIVIQKVKQVREIYHSIINTFDAYGNQNYYDTVVEGIPAFLLHYDARFEPQNHILTMDYPVLGNDSDCGVNVILSYVKKIQYEQEFLHAFPKSYVEEVLSQYHAHYCYQFFNICVPILRHLVLCALIHSPITKIEFSEEDDSKLDHLVKQESYQELESRIEYAVRQIVDHMKDYIKVGEEELYQYLLADRSDFVTELSNGFYHRC